MASAMHENIVAYLFRCFDAPNTPALWGILPPTIDLSCNPPIKCVLQTFHPIPPPLGRPIAPDLAIQPNIEYVDSPPLGGPGPPSDMNNNPHARIICEVAVFQTALQLDTKCRRWLNEPFVQYALGIKIYRPRVGAIMGFNMQGPPGRQFNRFNRTMIATLYGRNIFGAIIILARHQFGTHLFGTGIPNFIIGVNQITIPVNHLFLPPNVQPVQPLPPILGNFNIDLNMLQRAVLFSTRG